MFDLLFPKLHKEGYRFVAIAAVVSFVLILISKLLGLNLACNTCIDAKKISSLIKNNLESLNKIEPYYHWNEIKDLMEFIPKQLCRE